jgi:hypothetical protein
MRLGVMRTNYEIHCVGLDPVKPKLRDLYSSLGIHTTHIHWVV